MKRPVAAFVLAIVVATATTPATLAAACRRTSEAALEQQVMCLVCGTPLALAQSPQADRERVFIDHLVGRCESEGEIKAALVAQYGPRVLAVPKDGGFGIAAYLVPALLLLLVGAGIGAAVLRQRGAGPGLGGLDPSRGGAEPTASETRRLEAELGRFEG